MLRFQHSNYLMMLIASIPVIVLMILFIIWTRKKILATGDERLVRAQLTGLIPGRNITSFILVFLAFAIAVIGAANLQRAGRAEHVDRKGIDLIIALDVSKSMLATDIQPDRLTRAKQLIERLLTRLHNDRVGLILFAGRAYQQVPVTTDYAAFRMLLQTVTPASVPSQGTVIGDAIKMANGAFSQKEKKHKVLILISDGEDHDPSAEAAAQEAADAGVIIHTIGVGSPQGITLIDPETHQPKLDEQGNTVVSKLNEEELKNLAAKAKGTYNLLTNPDEIADRISNETERMESRSMGMIEYRDFTSYFQYFLLPALLLLTVERLIPGARKIQKAEKK